MTKEEVSRLAGEVLSGVNRVIETLGAFAPQGDALITNNTEISDEDVVFYGRIASALSLLRACANRLVLLSTENGAHSEVRVKQHNQLPTDDEKPPRRPKSKPGSVVAWILKRLTKYPHTAMKKADLVRLGVAAGFSDPALYHQIVKLLASGQIVANEDHTLSPPPNQPTS
jgi:hypothetical protein